MAKLIFLGTSNAISDEQHENTHMVLVGTGRTVLIDCPNSSVQRFQKANVDIKKLDDLIVTHFHPDHVSGVPQLLMNMWLMGRHQPLMIYGLQHTLNRLESLMDLYGWREWPGFFPVEFCRLAQKPLTPVLDCEEFHIFATPVQHFIPTIGLRIEFSQSDKILAYSCDTEPCAQIIQLAEGADVLIHESSGALPGHSSAAQAGAAAQTAEVGALYLIHYPTGPFATGDPVAEARIKYEGPVILAQDYMSLDFTEN